MRTVKILLGLCISLLCLFYATQNVANIEQAYGAVAYVIGNLEHEVYPISFGPSVTHPGGVWLATVAIIAMEYLAGMLAFKGAWDLWAARKAPAESFARARKFVNLGAGVGMLTWFGLFQVIGGAFFQQWQTAAGEQSVRHAALFVTMLGVVVLYINLVPDD